MAVLSKVLKGISSKKHRKTEDTGAMVNVVEVETWYHTETERTTSMMEGKTKHDRIGWSTPSYVLFGTVSLGKVGLLSTVKTTSKSMATISS